MSKRKNKEKKQNKKNQKKNKCIAVLGVCFHIKSEAAVNVSPGCVQDPLEPSPWFRSTFDCFPTVLVRRLVFFLRSGPELAPICSYCHFLIGT